MWLNRHDLLTGRTLAARPGAIRLNPNFTRSLATCGQPIWQVSFAAEVDLIGRSSAQDRSAHHGIVLLDVFPDEDRDDLRRIMNVHELEGVFELTPRSFNTLPILKKLMAPQRLRRSGESGTPMKARRWRLLSVAATTASRMFF